MNTCIISIKDDNLHKLEEAAAVIKQGGLVAFPTETVYGLGANAFNINAVKRIYEAKGRPSDNPLILHVCQVEDIYTIAKNISDTAKLLIDQFCPGALTLIFEKKDNVPLDVSGGLNTVAVRLPQNIIARQLIKYSGVPIAAPSANISGRPSPTTVEHVKYDLNGKVDMIIDGGVSKVGLESTVIDVTNPTPILLRPGSITIEMLESVVGKIDIDPSILGATIDKPKAPGMKYKHYSPKANITIYEGDISNIISKINEDIAKNICKCGILATEQTKHLYNSNVVLVMGDRNKPETIASNLFHILRKCDELDLEYVYAESFSEFGIFMAIMNRLKKAAAYSIVRC